MEGSVGRVVALGLIVFLPVALLGARLRHDLAKSEESLGRRGPGDGDSLR